MNAKIHLSPSIPNCCKTISNQHRHSSIVTHQNPVQFHQPATSPLSLDKSNLFIQSKRQFQRSKQIPIVANMSTAVAPETLHALSSPSLKTPPVLYCTNDRIARPRINFGPAERLNRPGIAGRAVGVRKKLSTVSRGLIRVLPSHFSIKSSMQIGCCLGPRAARGEPEDERARHRGGHSSSD